MGAKILSMAFMVLFVIFSLAPGDGVAFSQDQGGGRPAPPMSAVSGKAVETMDSGGYTYVLLEKEGEKKACPLPISSFFFVFELYKTILEKS